MGNGNRFRLNLDTFTIFYMVIIYPLIPIGVSVAAFAWMSVPFVLMVLAGIFRTGGLSVNHKMLPLFIIPLLALLSDGITAKAYAGKIGISILSISVLHGDLERNYQVFLKWLRMNGLIVFYSMIFEYFFRDIAIALYTPIWNIYLHGDSISLLQSTLNARYGEIYGIIPSATYAVNALSFAVGTYLVDMSRRKNRVMMFLLYIGIFTTGRRSHIVFVTTALIILFLVIGEGRTKGKRLFVGVFILVLALGAWFAIEPYVTYSTTGIGRLLATIKYFNDPVYIEKYYIRAERDILGKYAWGLFKSNWLTGVGWGNFSKIYLADTGIWRMNAHSTYLQVLCESGLFAAIVIFGVLSRELLYSVQAMKRDRMQFIFCAYVIILCVLIGLTVFIFDLTQFYGTFFFCIYFMRNMGSKKSSAASESAFLNMNSRYYHGC